MLSDCRRRTNLKFVDGQTFIAAIHRQSNIGLVQDSKKGKITALAVENVNHVLIEDKMFEEEIR